MAIKISKVIKDLNVGRQTIEEFLHKKGIEIDASINARIQDDVYEMLVKEFKPDMDLKSKSDKMANERQKEKAKHNAAAKAESHEIKTEIQRPKFLGKIDLAAAGKPKPAPSKPAEKDEQPAAEPQAPAVEPQAPAADVVAPAPAPAVEEKESVQPPVEPRPAEPVAEPAEASEAVEPKVEEPQQQPVAEQAPASPAEPATEVFRPVSQTVSGPQLKVVGKVDLTSLNQQTRPRKKTKEEKRNERIAKAQAEGGGKRKRKRIGKEKIDIETAGNQPSSQPGKNRGGKDDQGGKRGKDKKGNRKPLRPEVSEEDVQRQMKETLARLTAKTSKKAAARRRERREEHREEIREEAALAAAQSKILKLTEFVTANDLAIMMNVPINKVIATCMNLGVMVSINQRLDAETINIVADEFGFKTEYTSAEVVEAISEEEDDPADLVQRPPVVTVMGHVDHGKTSLLDYIRNSNVIAGEAGGITQHIGAYNVKLPNGRRITFLDTPGHEAFTAMRARGAKVTDIVIVIVAADDSVMPQTVEALNHASAAGVPIIFAINKIDKPGANPEKIKEELANMNYLVEDWGGKYQSQDISAKKGTGVEELMEKVLLEADMLDLKANPNRKATGSIIESSLDKGRGYIATVLVDNGTLHVGDIVLAGTHYGKVKAMFNERNVRITESGPSTPALILGLDGAPTAGDKFNVMDTDQEARQIANKREQLQRELSRRTQTRVSLEDIGRRRALGEFHELNIIVKGDVDGSIEALSDSLIKLSTPEVQVNVIHKAVGAITESDVTLAAASDAYIVGFQVRPAAAAKRAAEQEGVDIRLYSIIYDAIEEVKSAMEGMLQPDIKEEVIGSAEVRQVYHISKVGTIAGAMVIEGKIKRGSKVRVIRDGIVIHTGELASLKRFKDDAKEVTSGYDCGLSLKSYNDLQEMDIIEAFEEIEVHKSL
ncbi:MAG: translation initiation factor IF-2 [Muribaculaceae bacterium]|nr:translation initiation factor IF-2 [Muribaculaceae bacterium]